MCLFALEFPLKSLDSRLAYPASSSLLYGLSFLLFHIHSFHSYHAGFHPIYIFSVVTALSSGVDLEFGKVRKDITWFERHLLSS